MYDERAILIEFLNPMVVSIGYIKMAVSVGGQALGIIEKASTGSFGTPARDILAPRSEFLDSVVVRIRHIDKAGSVNSNAARKSEIRTVLRLGNKGIRICFFMPIELTGSLLGCTPIPRE